MNQKLSHPGTLTALLLFLAATPAAASWTSFTIGNEQSFGNIAVGHLSDRIRGGDAFTKAWPKSERPLTKAEKENLQKMLAAQGHYDGPIDGLIGSGSRGAIHDYQLKVGLTPDGVESVELLRHLEANR